MSVSYEHFSDDVPRRVEGFILDAIGCAVISLNVPNVRFSRAAASKQY